MIDQYEIAGTKLSFITRDEVAMLCRSSLLYALRASEPEANTVRRMVRKALPCLSAEQLPVVLTAFTDKTVRTPVWNDFIGELEARLN